MARMSRAHRIDGKNLAHHFWKARHCTARHPGSERLLAPAAILNFTEEKYALTVVPADDVADADPLKLARLEARSFGEAISFSRPGNATYVGEDGLIRTANPDVPRFDWTNGRRQLLLEGPATNFVTWSGYEVGSQWFEDETHNGLRARLVGAGLFGDIPYADYELSGTLTSGQATPFIGTGRSIASGASKGQTWTASVYTMLLAGEWPPDASLGAGVFEIDDSNSYVTGDSATGDGPGLALSRVTVTRTLTTDQTKNARSALQVLGSPGITSFNGQVVRIFGWQLELGSCATSLIQTQGGAVTRVADNASIRGNAANLMLREEASILLQGEGFSSAAGRFLGYGGVGRHANLSLSEDVILIGESGVYPIAKELAAPLPRYGLGIATSPSGKVGSYNGAEPTGNSAPLTKAALLFLGRSGSAYIANGWYDGLTIWPFRMSDAELQTKAVPYA